MEKKDLFIFAATPALVLVVTLLILAIAETLSGISH